MDPQNDLNALEAHLAGALKPVAPPGDLIQRLRERVRLPAREEIVLRLQDWRKLFLIFGGVMSGLLLLITVARAFFHLARKQI
ncbi:MAG: hypothetical protein IT313_01570 [Anaerolineales bacterium]|nr:hypothetical protein [Anaerolineales bacterium]